MRGVMVVVGAAICGSACSPRVIMKDRWHRATLVASTALIACDWGMTRWMPATGAYERGYVELNPLLGRKPSVGQVDAVFTVALLAHVAAYPQLPKWARAWWYTTVTAVELANVAAFNPAGVCGDVGALR